MLVARITLLGLVLPAVVAGFFFLIVRLGGAKGRRGERFSWAAATGIAAGYCVGHLSISGAQSFPPVESTQWLFYLVAVSAGLGTLEGLWRAPPWLTWALRSILVGALLWFTLRPLAQHSWSAPRSALWFSALAAGTILFWASLDRFILRGDFQLFLFTIIATAGAAGAVFVLSGSARLSQLALAVAAVVVGSFVATPRQAPFLVRAMAPVLVTISLGLWLNGYFYTEVGALGSASLALAPLGAWIAFMPRVARLGAIRSRLVGLGAVALILLPAVVHALVKFLSMEPYY